MLTRPGKLLRAAATVLALALVTSAFAQQPLTVPNYYAFQLHDLEAGIEVLGTLDQSDGQNFKDGSRLDLYALDARAGEAYALSVMSFDFEPVISVFDHSGNLVAFGDYGEEYGTVSASFVADASGGHVVVVSGWSEFDLGSYELTMTQASQSATTAVKLPSEISSDITSAMAPAPGGFGGGAELFSFQVEEELLLLAAMHSIDVDPVLTLYDEFGTMIASNDDDGLTTDSLLVAYLQPGSYVLAAGTYFAGETGAYTLSLETYYPR